MESICDFSFSVSPRNACIWIYTATESVHMNTSRCILSRKPVSYTHLFSQLVRDYGDKEAKVVMNTVGNIFSGQVVGETAKR